jgi:putative FmdB family regulatory protein
MPFYEYQCQACGAQVEVLQKISDAPLKKCPECGRSRLTKLISAPSFRLAGGGWYETDFKTDKDKKKNLVEASKAEPAAEGKAESKTETKEAKPDSKPEPKPEPKSDPKPAAKPVKTSTAKPAKRKAKR